MVTLKIKSQNPISCILWSNTNDTNKVCITQTNRKTRFFLKI